MRKYKQGEFKPVNPQKYVGTVPIVYRSSWEYKLMKFLDTNPGILRWMSESVVIPYVSPVDGKVHRYFTDFAVEFMSRTKGKQKAIIEVKPESQSNEPKQGRNKEKYMNEVVTYAVNQAKWKAAEQWCKKNNMEFWVLTEYDLGIAKRK